MIQKITMQRMAIKISPKCTMKESAHGMCAQGRYRKKKDQDRISGNGQRWVWDQDRIWKRCQVGRWDGRIADTPNGIRDNTKKTEARGTPRSEFVWRESAKK